MYLKFLKWFVIIWKARGRQLGKLSVKLRY